MHIGGEMEHKQTYTEFDYWAKTWPLLASALMLGFAFGASLLALVQG